MTTNTQPRGRRPALDHFLAGINEHVFQTKLGIADIDLVNYLNQLLSRYIRFDSLKGIASGTGSPTRQILELMSAAQESRGSNQRNLYQAIGDYTLFWAGIYPEGLQTRHNACFPQGLLDYTLNGKYCYAIAYQMSSRDHQPTQQILQCLSQHYELCVFGFGEVRREWERCGENNAIGKIA
jgi:hypothetical protein